MPSYKLVYFNSRGRAEPIRILLAYVGQNYEDVRYAEEEWPKHKADAPLEQLPYLEVDGNALPQSRAIMGYLAREFGIHGANNAETTKIEVILATLEDLIMPLVKIYFMEKDPAKQQELLDGFLNETAPRFLGGLERMLKENKGGEGYFVGPKISTADIYFFSCADFFKEEHKNALKNYHKLTALRDRIGKEPRIAAYMAKRPK